MTYDPLYGTVAELDERRLDGNKLRGLIERLPPGQLLRVGAFFFDAGEDAPRLIAEAGDQADKFVGVRHVLDTLDGADADVHGGKGLILDLGFG